MNQLHAPNPTRSPPPAAATSVARPAEAFEERAAAILGGREPVTAGKLHLLNFGRLRERFADAWPHMAPKAEALMRRTIEKRLNPGDVYRKGPDLDFVMLFAALSPQEGRLKCAQIAEEITRALVGDLGVDAADIDAGAAIVDSKAMLGVLSQGGDLAQALDGEIVKAAAATAASKAEHPSGFENVLFLFRPIWDVRRSAVINFFTLPVVKTPSGRILSGESAIEGLDDRHARLDYDLRLLKRVIDELMRVGAQDRRLLFTIPVHVDTVSSAAFRTEYIRMWRELPLSLQRLAIFDLVGGSEGFPQSRLLEILPSLKPMARAITLRMPLIAAPLLGRFAHVGLHALSAEAGSVREEGLIADFGKFVVAAEKAQLLTYLHGIRTGSLALAAVAAGFNFLDGPAIGSAAAIPKDAMRFGMADLHAGR